MNQLLARFVAIALLRRGPQDLPDSGLLLAISALAYGLTGLLLATIGQNAPPAMLLAVIDLGLTAGLLYVLLWARGLQKRYVRSLTAIYGSGALLEIVIWPLLSWLQGLDTTMGVSNPALLGSLLLWAWLFWNIVVIGHILAQTLGTRFFIGMGLALVYTYLSLNISRVMLATLGG